MPDEINADEKMEPDDEELQELYKWLDDIPLSRVKKNVGRDFSDAGEKHCLLTVRHRGRNWSCSCACQQRSLQCRLSCA